MPPSLGRCREPSRGEVRRGFGRSSRTRLASAAVGPQRTNPASPGPLATKEAHVTERKRVSTDEIEAEDAVSLPNKEVMSLLDVNANVDLGLDLAAPVDLAVAANLNVAAPIEASASANLLSPDAQAVSLAQQHGSIDQGISGTAEATAPQHADVSQNANPPEGGGATA